jgi:flagellin
MRGYRGSGAGDPAVAAFLRVPTPSGYPVGSRADKAGVFRIGSNYRGGPGLFALKLATRAVNVSLERLATGRRINGASDDPAGAVAVDQFRAREAMVRKKIDLTGRESERLGATEGTLSVVQDLAIELCGHVIASANRGALIKDELAAHQQSVDSMLQTIDHLTQTTTHEGSQITAGYASAKLGQPWNSAVLSMLGSGGDLNLVDGDLEMAGRVAEAAVGLLSDGRGAIGTRMKELDHQHRLLETELGELAGARSQIEDTDVASEAAALARAFQEVAAYTASLTSRLQEGPVLTLLTGIGTR